MQINSTRKVQLIKVATILLVIIVLVIFVSGSYAVWQKVIIQNHDDSLITSCLDISYDNESNAINVPVMFPMTNIEGSELNPYTFSITNNCKEYIDYTLALESVEVGSNVSYISDNYIKIKLDNKSPAIYNSLTTVNNDTSASYNIRNTKKVVTRYIGPQQTISHSIRLFLDENTPSSEMNKSFMSKVRIMTSQEEQLAHAQPDNESYYTVDSLGVLSNITKSGDIVIPDSVNGVKISQIDKIGTIVDGNFSPKELYNVSLDLANMTGLTTIGNYAFGSSSNQDPFTNNSGYGHSQNTGRLVIPFGVQSIGDYAFQYFTGSNTGINDELIFPSTLKSIGQYAFLYYGSDLASKYGSSYEIYGNQSHNYLELNNGLQTIGQGAFKYYVGTDVDLVIPNSVTTIGDEAFWLFDGSKLKIGIGLSTIPESCFYSYKGLATDLIIPNNVEIISNEAFNSYIGKSLTLENGVEEIGNSAFMNYNGSDIVIPSSVKKIGENAFAGMDNSKTITIKRSDASNMILGNNWNGSAEVVFSAA